MVKLWKQKLIRNFNPYSVKNDATTLKTNQSFLVVSTITNNPSQTIAKEKIHPKEYQCFKIKVKSDRELIKRSCSRVQEKNKEIRQKLAWKYKHGPWLANLACYENFSVRFHMILKFFNFLQLMLDWKSPYHQPLSNIKR